MRVNVETERLILRNLVVEDAEAVFVWASDPVVNEFMIYPLHKNIEVTREWLKSKDINDPDDYDIGIVLKETGELIGSGGFTYSAERDAWVVGYNIRKEYWGRGLVPEAMQALLELIRSEREVKAIEGEFAKANKKSGRVMEKLGMSYYSDYDYEKFDGSRRYEGNLYRREF